MVKAKKFILNKRFSGFPKEGDLKLVEYELPAIKDGQFLAESIYMSVDPYMRAYAENPAWINLGDIMFGSQVAKIIESKHPKFPVGKYVVAYFGWTTHAISDGLKGTALLPPWLLPDFQDFSLSLSLGVLGMPGNTAYFGFLEICQPKAGETVVVSGAAGAVGSHVGQIAKIKGCRVIGIAGSDEKAKWLTEELGFDYCINYKHADVAEELKKAAPKGVDIYFDNVGGQISSDVIDQINIYGRVSVCGSISNYNDTVRAKASAIQSAMVTNEIKMEGFHVMRWENRWMEGVLQNMQWIKEGKLKYSETLTHGFENMFNAFVGMLRGENTGKALVKV